MTGYPNPYGEYKNILINWWRIPKVKRIDCKVIPIRWLKKLSRYIKSSGKDYQDHYVNNPKLVWTGQRQTNTEKGRIDSYLGRIWQQGTFIIAAYGGGLIIAFMI